MSRFHFVNEPSSWEAARLACQAMDMELASIHSQAEHEEVIGLVNGRTTWIGLTDHYESLGGEEGEGDGDWRWSDGTPMDFSSWYAGQPDGGSAENCGLYGPVPEHQGWIDWKCGSGTDWHGNASAYLCGLVGWEKWWISVKTHTDNIDNIDAVLIVLLVVTNLFWCLCICRQYARRRESPRLDCGDLLPRRGSQSVCMRHSQLSRTRQLPRAGGAGRWGCTGARL